MGKEELESMAEVARQRSNVYGFLALIYREEVTASLLRRIKDAQFQKVLSDLGVRLEREFLEMPEEKLIEDLAVEYAMLFLGPGKHISPHESVHQKDGKGSGLLWGETTVKVKKFIEASGLEYKPDYRGIPDHISVELEFMQEVAKQEAQNWEKGDDAKALFCMEIEKKFLEEHLTRWVPLFCDTVTQDAELPFYREMANLTKSFIELEKE